MVVTVAAQTCPRCRTLLTVDGVVLKCLACGYRDSQYTSREAEREYERLMPSADTLAEWRSRSRLTSGKSSKNYKGVRNPRAPDVTFTCAQCGAPKILTARRYRARVEKSRRGLLFCKKMCSGKFFNPKKAT